MLCCLISSLKSYIGYLSDCIATLFSLCWILFMMCVILIPVIVILLFLIRYLIQKRARTLLPELRAVSASGKKPLVVGFFHPYCNAGGGGERVLWTAIRALQNKYEHVRCVVYTGDTDASREDILSKAKERFNISLPRTTENQLHFIYFHQRRWVEAKPYPVLTLLGQSLGSLVLGMDALLQFVPDVYLDTMGYAFTLPLFKYLGGSQVGCYVHYPTISTDMLLKVSDRTESFNNASLISRSPVLSSLKLIYYKIFAFAYGVAGKRSDVIMVNSTWTHGHICEIWGSPEKTNIVYPPCDVTEFLKIPLADDSGKKQHNIVSLAQFRPEKDHPLQIKSFAAFLDSIRSEQRGHYKLLLVGGCRNAEDEERVRNLKQLCKDLSVENAVEFRLNVSFADLKRSLQESTIGLHTMWNEHFGIGVVECMAAGTVMLAHNSGGPKLDIVKDFNDQKTGYLATDVQSYAEAMREIFEMSPEERTAIKTNARESVTRFSEEEFEAGFLASTELLLGN